MSPTRKRSNFTATEIEMIRENFVKMRLCDLAKLLPSHSMKTIENKAHSMGLFKKETKPRKWSNEEETWFKQNYANATLEQIHLRFPNDKIDTITTKAYNLGLSRKVAVTLQSQSIDGNIVQTKKCSKCRKVKLVSSFSHSSKNSSGYKSICKECALVEEQGRRSQFTEEKKAMLRKRSNLAAKIRRQNNPDKNNEKQKASYQKHRPKRLAKMRERHAANLEHDHELTKQWRQLHRFEVKASNMNRKAMHRSLPHTLTKNDLKQLIPDSGIKTCALTGLAGECHLEHFIPMSWGHGGSYLGNVYYLIDKLHYKKRNRNPFEWLDELCETATISFQMRNHLTERLAMDNGLSIDEFKEFVYWCEHNKRSIEQSKVDKRTSIEIWLEQKNRSTKN